MLRPTSLWEFVGVWIPVFEVEAVLGTDQVELHGFNQTSTEVIAFSPVLGALLVEDILPDALECSYPPDNSFAATGVDALAAVIHGGSFNGMSIDPCL